MGGTAICRRAALPRRSLACLVPDSALAAESLLELQQALERSAASVASCLERSIPDIVDRPTRLAAIQAKRAAKKWRTDGEFDAVSASRVGVAATDFVSLKCLYRKSSVEFQQRFDVHVDSVTKEMFEILDLDIFCGALVLASPHLWARIQKARSIPIKEWKGREWKALASFLGYCVRAATKTSPFSSFTLLGICIPNNRTSNEDHPTTYRRHSEISRRWIASLLQRTSHASVCGATAPIVLNPTLYKTKHEYVFFRGPTLEGAGSTASEGNESVIALETSPSLDRIVSLMQDAEMSLDTLLGHVSLNARTYVERLLELGFLTTRLPFDDNDAINLRTIAEHFGRREGRIESALSNQLYQMADFTHDFGAKSAAERQVVLSNLEKTASAIEREIGLSPPVRPLLYETASYVGGMETSLHDVSSILGDLKSVSLASAALDPLLIKKCEYAQLLNEASSESVPFMEFYRILCSRTDPLTTSGGVVNLVNEYRQELLRELHTERASNIAQLFTPALAQVLERCPYTHFLPSSATVHAQKGPRPGDPWVLNALSEGHARAISRFGRMFVDVPLSRAPTVPQRDVIFADIRSDFGSSVGIRSHPNGASIPYPGARCGDRNETTCPVGDLLVEVVEGVAHLRHAQSGRTVFPFNGSQVAHARLPRLARCLLDFGQARPSLLPWSVFIKKDGAVTPRVHWGALLVSRRRWDLSKERLPQTTAGNAPAARFLEMMAWRQAERLPDEVFVSADYFELSEADFLDGRIAADPYANFKRKPQYHNFNAPLLLDRMDRIIDRTNSVLRVTEAYPPVLAATEPEYVSEMAFEICF